MSSSYGSVSFILLYFTSPMCVRDWARGYADECGWYVKHALQLHLHRHAAAEWPGVPDTVGQRTLRRCR